MNFNKFFRVDGEDVRLMLWDTAGQEEFDAITAAYYRGAHACVLAFSATDRDSFEAIPSWKIKVCLFFSTFFFVGEKWLVLVGFTCFDEFLLKID